MHCIIKYISNYADSSILKDYCFPFHSYFSLIVIYNIWGPVTKNLQIVVVRPVSSTDRLVSLDLLVGAAPWGYSLLTDLRLGQRTHSPPDYRQI